MAAEAGGAFAQAKAAGVDGIVIGILRRDGTVDAERTRAMLALARPMSVTFHRAFDATPDALGALDTLIELGVDRVLTSGQASSVVDGLDVIAELVTRAKGRIVIMACGGVNEHNAARVIRESGVRELHARSGAVPSRLPALLKALNSTGDGS